ncbi:hypothetical protein NKH18_44030 [Streptomyces sp. M10(2022)]
MRRPGFWRKSSYGNQDVARASRSLKTSPPSFLGPALTPKGKNRSYDDFVADLSKWR